MQNLEKKKGKNCIFKLAKKTNIKIRMLSVKAVAGMMKLNLLP